VVLLEKWIENGKGQGFVEYALILVLVAILVIVILAQMGPTVGNVFSVMMLVFDPDPEGPTEIPEECYSTILLPMMVAGMSILVSISSMVSRKSKEKDPHAAFVDEGIQSISNPQSVNTV
jgi:pilus assembly protein Flp/PilA